MQRWDVDDEDPHARFGCEGLRTVQVGGVLGGGGHQLEFRITRARAHEEGFHIGAGERFPGEGQNTGAVVE